jgi:hypothetical protein
MNDVTLPALPDDRVVGTAPLAFANPDTTMGIGLLDYSGVQISGYPWTRDEGVPNQFPSVRCNAVTYHDPVYVSAGTSYVGSIVVALNTESLLVKWLVRRQVHEAADTWEREAVGASDFLTASEHPAYRVLAGQGRVALEVALERLDGSYRPMWLGFLRRFATDPPQNPVPGNIDDAAKLWRAWGRRHGFQTAP